MRPHEAGAGSPRPERARECPGCEFRPFSEAYDRDPHPTHAHLREHHRVYFWEEMDAWVLSHHADVDWLLKRAPVGTSDVHWSGASPAEDGAATASPWDRLRRQTITFQEGAAHARMRSSVSRAFTPGAVTRLGPAIAAAVDDALDRIGEGPGSFDLVAELTSRVPIQVLGRLLGVPAELEPEFCRHAARLQNVINPLGDAEARADADASALAVRGLIEAMIRDAARRPRDADLLSALVHQGEGGLPREELVGLVTSILMAGAETTGGMVNHAMAALLAHPAALALLRAEPGRIDAAVVELARFEFPTKFVTRYPLEPIEVAGTRIGAGELVFGAERLPRPRSPRLLAARGAGAELRRGRALLPRRGARAGRGARDDRSPRRALPRPRGGRAPALLPALQHPPHGVVPPRARRRDAGGLRAARLSRRCRPRAARAPRPPSSRPRAAPRRCARPRSAGAAGRSPASARSAPRA